MGRATQRRRRGHPPRPQLNTEDQLALAAALPVPPADELLSLGLSHLAIDTNPAAAADRLATIAEALPPGRRIQVGAEVIARTDAVLGCVLDVAGRGLAERLGAMVQASLLRSERDVDTLTGCPGPCAAGSGAIVSYDYLPTSSRIQL